MKKILPVLLLAAGAKCFAGVDIGFAEATLDGSLYVYTSATIERSTPILVKLDIDRSAECCKQFVGRDFQKVESVDAVMGDQEVARYRLDKFDTVPPSMRSIGVAVINATTAANQGDDVVAMAGGRRYVVNACLTSEGVELTLRQHGRVQNRLYYALGYDVAPTCGKKLNK